MESRSEVVITGVGAVSPLGVGGDAVWQSLSLRTSGVKKLPWLEDSPWPVKIGAEVAGFDPKQYVKPRKALKVMSHEIQVGYVAAMLARDQALLDPGTVESSRIGVVYGADMLYCHPKELAPVYARCMSDGEFQFEQFGPSAMKELFPLWMLLYLPNMVACHIGIALDARGPTNTITLGEVSGMEAVIEAIHVIERGHADVMVAGGVGNRLSPTPMVYRRDLYQSHRNDDPTAASRPFDADRDGMVCGQGAAAFVLERREHAERRGAAILARILGTASRFGRNAQPGVEFATSVDAIQNSITAAVDGHDRPAGLVAHGLSTQLHDKLEARAIQQTCGSHIPVTAPKSFYGNCGAASSALDLLVAVLAINHKELPATLNYHKPDPECPVEVVSEAQSLEAARLVVLSQTTSGQAAAIYLGGE